LRVPENSLDILAQQCVATVATGEIGVEELWALVRRAHPFRRLARDDFDAVVDMLADGVATRRGRRGALVHLDRVHGRLRPRRGAAPTIPFWLGEAPARTRELSAAVSALRAEVGARLGGRRAAAAWLAAECGLTPDGAEQIAGYLAEGQAGLGALPTQRCVVAERFFDEAGGMQLVVHAPFGGRINRAWGLALRKRFCVTFNFELQAAAADDGLVISLGEQHSFPLDSVFAMVRPETLREDLVQAALASPLFTNRWRWNATRSLALLP